MKITQTHVTSAAAGAAILVFGARVLGETLGIRDVAVKLMYPGDTEINITEAGGVVLLSQTAATPAAA